MVRRCAWFGLATLLAWAVACAPAGAAGGQSAFGRSHKPVCSHAPVHFASCDAEVVTDTAGTPLVTPAPAGYGPADLQDAYDLTTLAAAPSTATVAIIDAFDHPGAESDLAVYRSRFGLAPCTTANGCFRKVDQRGGSSYPQANASWGQEISLDLDMVSAVCPHCHILLVEADSSNLSDLAASVDEAAALGATQISNSYSGDEYRGETTDQSHYDHPGIAITASTGDEGYGAQFPATSRYVTAVGGTSLTRNGGVSGGWSQSAWSGAGSGCSAFVRKPAWQTDTGCAKRTVADVSAVADPDTGVAIYTTSSTDGSSGWMVFGGTSAAAPIVAGIDALLGPGAASPSYPYQHPSAVVDVVGGSNGTCAFDYLCTGVAGYDGPTGLGTLTGSQGSGGPAAISGSADVTDVTATVSGTVDPDGAATSVHFEYGTTTDYGQSSPDQSVGSTAGAQDVSTVLAGLQPDTIYHFRLVATSACGCASPTAYGDDVTFQTAPAPAAPATVESTTPIAPPAADDPTTTTTTAPAPGAADAPVSAAPPVVVPVPVPAPVVVTVPHARIRFAITRRRLATVLRHGLQGTLSCTDSCSTRVTVVLEPLAARASGRRLAMPASIVVRLTRRLTHAGRYRVTLRLPARARAALARSSSATFRLELIAGRGAHRAQTSLLRFTNAP